MVKPALIGKAGEMLVAAELMRRGVEVAHPASDVGVGLLAYRLSEGHAVPAKIVPIQVKAYSGTGYVFQKRWFERAPGVVLYRPAQVLTRLPRLPRAGRAASAPDQDLCGLVLEVENAGLERV